MVNYSMNEIREFLPKTMKGLLEYRRELIALPQWAYVKEELYKVDLMIEILNDNPNHYE